MRNFFFFGRSNETLDRKDIRLKCPDYKLFYSNTIKKMKTPKIKKIKTLSTSNPHEENILINPEKSASSNQTRNFLSKENKNKKPEIDT